MYCIAHGFLRHSMIATLSAEKPQTEETISTAKFAQRVALVQNKAEINEERDPKLVIKRLKAEIKELKGELAFLRKGGSDDGEMDLTQTELNHLRSKVRSLHSWPFFFFVTAWLAEERWNERTFESSPSRTTIVTVCCFFLCYFCAMLTACFCRIPIGESVSGGPGRDCGSVAR